MGLRVRTSAGWLAIPPLVLLVLLLVVPLVLIVHQSLFVPELSLEKYARLLERPSFARGLRNSLEIAATAAILTALLGSLLLVALHRWRGRVGLVLIVILLMPFAANELVRIVAWVIFLSPAGPLNAVLQALPFIDEPLILVKNRVGVLIGLVHVLLPFFVLTAYASTRRIDTRLLRAAQSLGARPLQAFLGVYVPLAMPGIAAATLLVFVLGLGYYATPAALGGPGDVVLPTLIADQVQDVVDWGQAAALGVLLLGVTSLVLVVLARVGGLRVLYSTTAGDGGRPPGRLSRLWTSAVGSPKMGRIASVLDGTPALARVGSVALGIAVLLIVAYLLTPVLVAIPASFTDSRTLRFPPEGFSLQWYQDFLERGAWTQGASTSLLVGAAVAVLAVVLALCASIALVRGRARGRSQLLSFYLMPLIMPSIVTSLGLFFLFVSLGIAYTPIGIGLGHLVFALPYALLILVATVQSFDWELDRAAQALGAKWWHRLRDVYLPLLRPAVLAALLFAFIASFTELVFALFMHSMSGTTLPVVMWNGIRYEVSPTTAAASTLIILGVTLAALLFVGVAAIRERRRSGSEDHPG